MKKVFGNASIVSNGRVVFNIKANDYRLVVSVNFKQQACYIIWFGTHKEYDKIDVTTIAYDIKIAQRLKNYFNLPAELFLHAS